MSEHLATSQEVVSSHSIVVCLGGLAAGAYTAMAGRKGLYNSHDQIGDWLGKSDMAEIKMHDTVAMASLTVESVGQKSIADALHQSLGFLVDVSRGIQLRGSNLKSIRFAGPDSEVDERSGLTVMPELSIEAVQEMFTDAIIDINLARAKREQVEAEALEPSEAEQSDLGIAA